MWLFYYNGKSGTCLICAKDEIYFCLQLNHDIEFELFQSRLSTEREVVLDNVDFRTTGEYRCEVSGDAPMFQTASISGILFVVGKYKIIRSPCLDIVFGEP